MTRSLLVATAVVIITAVVMACSGPASTPSSIVSSATPSSVPAATSSASGATVGGAATFPPSQTAIAPGTYRWDGFERPVSVTVASGWEIGHDDPAFFDLFRGSDFPSVSFARFTDVYVDAASRSAATDAATVAATLGNRPDVTMTDPTAIELGGLHGLQFDLTTTAPKTSLFFGPAGDFRLEPTFRTRYRVLDFPGGGVLVIGVHGLGEGFDAAVALADPVTSTLRVEP